MTRRIFIHESTPNGFESKLNEFYDYDIINYRIMVLFDSRVTYTAILEKYEEEKEDKTSNLW
jgi:hypothetical protein